MALNVRNVVRTVFETDMSDLERGAGRGTKAFEGFAATVVKTGAVLTALTAGAVAVFLKSATEMASRAQEVQNLFDVSFGDMADAAEEWSQRTEAAVGVNDTTLKEFSGTLFNMTTAMGLSREGAFELATGFTELALDTASFFNIKFEEAFNKIRAGLVGESEPLKQLGVLVTENTVKQTAFAQAILATGRQLTETEKVQGRAIVIARGLANAQGDLIATSDSWANQTRLVGEAFVDLQETVGQFITDSQLLGSIIAGVTDKIRDLSDSIETNGTKWEEMVTGGLFLFLRGGEQTIRVIGILVDAFGFLINVVTLGTFGLTDYGQTVKDTARGLQEFADDLGQQIDGLVTGTNRMGDSVDRLGQIISAYEGQNESLTNQLRTELKKAIEQGGTIPMELYARVVENFGGLQDLAQESIGRMITELSKQRDVIVTTTVVTDKLTKAQKEVIKAQEQHEKQVRSLADSMGVAGLRGEMELLIEAIDRVRESGDVLSEQGFDKLSRAIEDLLANGQEVPELFREMQQEFLNTDVGGITRLQLEWNEALREAANEFDAIGGKGESEIRPLRLETDDATTATERWREAVEGLAHAFAAFGIDANSTLGQLIAGITIFSSQIEGLTKDIKSGNLLGGALAKDEEGERDFAGAAAGIAGGIGAIGQATSRGSTGARAGRGALAGAAAGAQVGGPIGAAVGAAAGAIVGFFRGRNAAKFAKDIERDFGAVLSEGLIAAIRDSGKDAAFFLADMFREGALSPDRLAEEIGDIFSGITQGKFTKPEAIEALESAIPVLIENFANLGEAGQEQVQRIISAAREMGVEFEGLQQLIQLTITDETLVNMGLVGESNVHRIRDAAMELGVEFQFLNQLIQDTFAPETLEGLAAQFSLTNDEVRAMGELLGIEIQTDLERIAASVGLTASEFTALGVAIQEQFGIPAEQLAEFLEATGLSAAELAESLGVDVSGGAQLVAESQELANERLQAGVDIAAELKEQLEGAARAAASIMIPGAGGSVEPSFPMQHGGVGEVSRPTRFLAGEAGREGFAFFPGGLPRAESDRRVPETVSLRFGDIIVQGSTNPRQTANEVVRAIRDNLGQINSELGKATG